MMRNRAYGLLAMGAFLMAAGCGSSDAPAGATAPSESAAATAAPTGAVHEVRMVTPGEVFEPAQLEVKRGDVVRFVLVAGVHNASFPADKNPAGVNLPAATPYLQAPGQTYDLVVDLPAGEYTYQCDPHAAMGMTGQLTVTD